MDSRSRLSGLVESTSELVESTSELVESTSGLVEPIHGFVESNLGLLESADLRTFGRSRSSAAACWPFGSASRPGYPCCVSSQNGQVTASANPAIDAPRRSRCA